MSTTVGVCDGPDFESFVELDLEDDFDFVSDLGFDFDFESDFDAVFFFLGFEVSGMLTAKWTVLIGYSSSV